MHELCKKKQAGKKKSVQSKGKGSHVRWFSNYVCSLDFSLFCFQWLLPTKDYNVIIIFVIIITCLATFWSSMKWWKVVFENTTYEMILLCTAYFLVYVQDNYRIVVLPLNSAGYLRKRHRINKFIPVFSLGYTFKCHNPLHFLWFIFYRTKSDRWDLFYSNSALYQCPSRWLIIL